MKSKFGSVLYGTNTPESDLDYKGIFIPDAKSLVLGNAAKSYVKNTSNNAQKNTADDVDEELYSLKTFLEMAIKGETIAIDMIHTPSELIVDYDDIAPWDFIVANRSKFYTTDMKAYLGYVRKQASKYGIKGSRLSALRKVLDWADTLPHTREVDEFASRNRRLKNITMINGKMHVDTTLGEFMKDAPIIEGHAFIKTVDGNDYYEVLSSAFQETLAVKRFQLNITRKWNEYGERARKAELNEGVDWKALHHACRAGMQLLEIYRTGDLKYPLYDAPMLLSIKQGKESFKVVSEYLEDIVENVEVASKQAAKNGMPEKVDRAFWDNMCYEVYMDHIKHTSGW